MNEQNLPFVDDHELPDEFWVFTDSHGLHHIYPQSLVKLSNKIETLSAHHGLAKYVKAESYGDPINRKDWLNEK